MLEFLLPILNNVLNSFFMGFGFWASYLLIEKISKKD